MATYDLQLNQFYAWNPDVGSSSEIWLNGKSWPYHLNEIMLVWIELLRQSLVNLTARYRFSTQQICDSKRDGF